MGIIWSLISWLFSKFFWLIMAGITIVLWPFLSKHAWPWLKPRLPGIGSGVFAILTAVFAGIGCFIIAALRFIEDNRETIVAIVIAALVILAVVFGGKQLGKHYAERQEKKEGVITVRMNIDGELNGAKFVPNEIPVEAESYVAIEIVSGKVLARRSVGLDKIDRELLAGDEFISPEKIVSLAVPGIKRNCRLDQEDNMTVFQVKEKGSLKFSADIIRVMPSKFYTGVIRKKKFLKGEVVVKVRPLKELPKKLEAQVKKIKPVETVIEKVTPSWMQVEPVENGYDLRKEAQEGWKELIKPVEKKEIEALSKGDAGSTGPEPVPSEEKAEETPALSISDWAKIGLKRIFEPEDKEEE